METIDIINKSIEKWENRFPNNFIIVSYSNLINNIYPYNKEDYSLYYANYYLNKSMEYKKLCAWISQNIFYPLVKAAITGISFHMIIDTIKVRLRIAISMINKMKFYYYTYDRKIEYSKRETDLIRESAVNKITQVFWDRVIACSKYYFDTILPF